jgi:alpha-amylase
MNNAIRLCLVLHNHQPIGNFGEVFEQAYQDSYLPFLDVFEGYTDLRISLHTSGPLMEWLDAEHPEYLDRLANLVAAGRVEIIGGAFYEPILTMIPSRDRIGQIQLYTQWLQERLGGVIRGMWMPERVWEQALTSDLHRAGIQYTVLDDFHFRNAGLTADDLHGYYVTEDDGLTLSIFPGSEQLRYTIPFRDPPETIEYLRGIAQRVPDAIAVFGDDGEKFGTWPETKQHCYEDGWLRRFFDLVSANQDWLITCPLSEAVDQVPPAGRIYLPDCSYREMTEWALPVAQQLVYEDVVHELEHDERWPRIQSFVRGGFWRNFKVKYPEANEMYSRMMIVSNKLQRATQDGLDGDQIDWARRELYRAQCNCSYWHGAFGGIYLPHLRNAVYNHLIAADNLLDRALGDQVPAVDATVDDFNFDARREVCLANRKLVALLAPADGGRLYELDVRTICHNVLATLSRRPEAYHRKVLSGPNNGDGCASIHDRVVFKQEGLDQKLKYDFYPRKSLVDHFYDVDVAHQAIAQGDAMERGDFAGGRYEAKLRKNPDRIQVQLSKQGNAWGIPLKLTKAVTMEQNSATLEIAYLIENIPADAQLHFGVEFNFAGMPTHADDRYFYGSQREALGRLGTELDLHDVPSLGLVDQWLGLDVRLDVNRPSGFWTFPIGTVSQSEGGIEMVHQSVVVQPHWLVRGDQQGKWSVVMRLTLDTSLAEQRQQHSDNAQAEQELVSVW